MGILAVHGAVALKHRRLTAYLKGVTDAVTILQPGMRGKSRAGKDAIRAFGPFLDSKKLFNSIRRRVRTGDSPTNVQTIG